MPRAPDPDRAIRPRTGAEQTPGLTALRNSDYALGPGPPPGGLSRLGEIAAPLQRLRHRLALRRCRVRYRSLPDADRTRKQRKSQGLMRSTVGRAVPFPLTPIRTAPASSGARLSSSSGSPEGIWRGGRIRALGLRRARPGPILPCRRCQARASGNECRGRMLAAVPRIALPRRGSACREPAGEV